MTGKNVEDRRRESRTLQREAALRLVQSEEPRDQERGHARLEMLELETDICEMKKAVDLPRLPELARSVILAEIQRLDHEMVEVQTRLSLLRGTSRLDAIHQAMKELLTREQRDAISARVREIRGAQGSDGESIEPRDEEPPMRPSHVVAHGPEQTAVSRDAQQTAAYAEYKASRLAPRA